MRSNVESRRRLHYYQERHQSEKTGYRYTTRGEFPWSAGVYHIYTGCADAEISANLTPEEGGQEQMLTEEYGEYTTQT